MWIIKFVFSIIFTLKFKYKKEQNLYDNLLGGIVAIKKWDKTCVW